MLYDFHSQGQNQSDCLVFEKTDGQSIEPDGCIKFTNVGTDNQPSLSMTIVGNVQSGQWLRHYLK
jgi:hypothetical protein